MWINTRWTSPWTSAFSPDRNVSEVDMARLDGCPRPSFSPALARGCILADEQPPIGGSFPEILNRVH